MIKKENKLVITFRTTTEAMSCPLPVIKTKMYDIVETMEKAKSIVRP